MNRFFLLIGLFACGCAQSQPLSTTTAPVATTDAYGNTPRNALGLVANQGALGKMNRFSAGLYAERRFGLKALSLYQLAVVQPAGDGAFGLPVFYAGDADYNVSKTGLAYGRRLGERLAIGVQFDYWSQHMRGYGNTAQVTFEAGALARFSSVLQVGIQVCNLGGVVLNKVDQKLPSVYTVGIGYQPSENIILSTELIKIEKLPLSVQAAIEYRFVQKAWAKAGLNSQTGAFFISVGFQLNGFSIEVAGAAHPQLGLSPGMLLAYNNTMDK